MVYSLSSFIDNLFNIATFHFFTRGWTQPCARPARRHARARHRPPPGRRRDCALPNCCTTLAAKLPRRFLIKYSKRVSICYCTQRERHDDEENSFASCGAVGVQLMARWAARQSRSIGRDVERLERCAQIITTMLRSSNAPLERRHHA